jgi:hypothetical protein
MIVQNSSTMVYCMTETNLWPRRAENGECPTIKGSAAVLPRRSGAVCPVGVRRTSVAPISPAGSGGYLLAPILFAGV